MNLEAYCSSDRLHVHQALEDTRRLLTDLNRTMGELQHALTHTSVGRTPLGGQRAEVALGELARSDREVQVDARTVMTVAAEYYGCTLNEFRGRRGTRSLSRARHIAMYLCREMTGLSLPEIGREFDRDHTTVMHGDRKIRHEVSVDARTAEQVRNLTNLIRNRTAVDVTRGARIRPPQRRVA